MIKLFHKYANHLALSMLVFISTVQLVRSAVSMDALLINGDGCGMTRTARGAAGCAQNKNVCKTSCELLYVTVPIWNDRRRTYENYTNAIDCYCVGGPYQPLVIPTTGSGKNGTAETSGR